MSRRLVPEYLPTPRQITRQCAAIRRQWTPSERRRRTVGYSLVEAAATWMPPMIDTAMCVSRVRKALSEASA